MGDANDGDMRFSADLAKDTSLIDALEMYNNLVKNMDRRRDHRGLSDHNDKERNNMLSSIQCNIRRYMKEGKVRNRVPNENMLISVDHKVPNLQLVAAFETARMFQDGEYNIKHVIENAEKIMVKIGVNIKTNRKRLLDSLQNFYDNQALGYHLMLFSAVMLIFLLEIV